MADALSTISTRRTPQNEKADARQVKNSAGGYTFKVNDDVKIHRFLTIGTEGGTYYTSEQKLTKDAAATVINVAQSDRGEWLVQKIVEISTAGRAPKQNPGIFALAVCAALGNDATRKAAKDAVPAVCRTGTSLFQFVGYSQNFRGWGRGLRRAVGDWIVEKDSDKAAYQMIKYRQREGWSQRDLLRLSHPKTTDPAKKALFDWVCGRDADISAAPDLLGAFKAAQSTTSVEEWVALIGDFPLSWEMLPDQALTNPKVWKALIEKGLPQTALMRQLPRLTNLGVLEGDALRTVVSHLTDQERLRKGRIHPVNVLLAARTYSNGRSLRGSNTWTPVRKVVDALDESFYKAFGTIEPAGKRTLLALDVSGSMGSSAGGTPLTCREVTAALALVMMASEPECDVVGFTGGGYGWSRYGNRSGSAIPADAISELTLSPRQRLDDAIRYIDSLPFGSTDCALPMLWAAAKDKTYDTICVMTDNETWAGAMHPHQALREYRNRVGVDTREVVVGMTVTDFTIADPNDPGTLDIAGFDSAVPNLISDFSRGDV
jgi:60 kDa SS-A/Ro ribonucleoprotein